jgi:hypothetical protein
MEAQAEGFELQAKAELHTCVLMQKQRCSWQLEADFEAACTLRPPTNLLVPFYSHLQLLQLLARCIQPPCCSGSSQALVQQGLKLLPHAVPQVVAPAGARRRQATQAVHVPEERPGGTVDLVQALGRQQHLRP